MISGKTILAIIPARGGSKGIPRKNVRDLLGKPLIAWTIEAAKKSKYIDRLIVSSEDDTIISIAKQWGCEAPFIRPNELALDDTPGIAPVLHAINVLPDKYDYIVLLQPTSPLRTVEDIDECIERCVCDNHKACVTVTESEQTPYWMYSINRSGYLVPIVKDSVFVQRQDLPPAYVLNGAVYVAHCEWLKCQKDFLTKETVAIIMTRDRSTDIDSEEDWILVEKKIAKMLDKNLFN